jgi:hypothetical protein
LSNRPATSAVLITRIWELSARNFEQIAQTVFAPQVWNISCSRDHRSGVMSL